MSHAPPDPYSPGSNALASPTHLLFSGHGHVYLHIRICQTTAAQAEKDTGMLTDILFQCFPRIQNDDGVDELLSLII